MALYDDLQASLRQLVEAYRGALADGSLSFREVVTLSSNVVATLIQLTEKYSGYSGEEKKIAVLAGLAKVYDEVIAPIDIHGIPNFLEPLVDKALRELILTLAGSWVDSLVNVFNRTGWGVDVGVTPPVVPADPASPVPDGFRPY